MAILRRYWPHLLTHILALLPLAVMLWDFTQNQLTANPIREIQLRTGLYALILLVLTLAVTPVNAIFRKKVINELRRTLGLYSFLYAGLHVLNFIAIDYGFDFYLIREDTLEKPYALVGLATFLLLLPLAITSTKWWIQRLGRKWRRLHMLVYPAALLAVIHFTMQEKADIRIPLVFSGVVALLLIVRIPQVKKLMVKLRG